MLGRIDGSYALDVAGSSGLSPTRCFPYCSPIHVTQTVGESDRCEHKVNKYRLTESAAYFGHKTVRNAWKNIICVH